MTGLLTQTIDRRTSAAPVGLICVAYDLAARQQEREHTYLASLKLLDGIDEELARGVRHYRDKAGVLLTTLDEVVRAILDDNLFLPDEESADLEWVPARELAA